MVQATTTLTPTVNDLLKKKEVAKEGELIEVSADLCGWMESKVSKVKTAADEMKPHKEAETKLLDDFFLQYVS